MPQNNSNISRKTKKITLYLCKTMQHKITDLALLSGPFLRLGKTNMQMPE